MLNVTINVLGTDYTVSEKSKVEDSFLEQCDGYCDKTSKKIVVKAYDKSCELDNFPVYQKQCIRHEIIHAFLFESGLHQNFKHDEWGHDETMIDWFAFMFPKMQKAFREAKAL